MRVLDWVWGWLPSSVYVPILAYSEALTHVQFIAKASGGAWLFRSAGPWSFPDGLMGSPTFLAEPVKSALRQASFSQSLAGNKAAPLPIDVRLLDINVLTGANVEEKRLIQIEADFFATHQDIGEFRHWSLKGILPEHFAEGCWRAGFSAAELSSCVSPSTATVRQPGGLESLIGSAARDRLIATFGLWDPDRLAQRVEELHGLVHARNDTAIFFHCSCGCDRTGELFAAYAITHLNWTAQEALHHNAALAGRPMEYENQVAVQWYCAWLKGLGRYHHDDCGACGGNIRCVDDGLVIDSVVRPLAVGMMLAVVCLMFGPIVACLLWSRHRHIKHPNVYKLYSPLLNPRKDSGLSSCSTASGASSEQPTSLWECEC